MRSFWTDRNWRVNRMMWRFNRSGGFGNQTWPYNDAPEEAKKIIHGKVSLNDHEIGLVMYFCDPGTWTLMTSDRLIGETSGSGFNTDLWAISKITWNICKGITRRSIETLTVEANCKSYTVSIEGPFKSGPYLGLWNAVLMVIRTGRRSKRSPD